MRRLQQVSFSTGLAPRQPSVQVRPATTPLPRDEMWRSRRVLSGSDWMDAWVRKPGQR